MRLDDVAPRTLLLGAFAGWALLAWVLALAGMGARLPEGESGAITTSRVPELPKGDGTPVLGPASQYGEIANRPLFATDRRPHPFFIAAENGQPDGPAEFDLVLTSVLITPQANLAIVQKPDGTASWRIKVGEAAESQPGWRLVALQPRSAIFQGPEGQKELTLRVFDGKGGAAPTSSRPALPVDPPATMGTTSSPGASSAAPAPVATVPAGPAPPPTNASSTPDPAQIEQIRQRIEARREEMRRRAQNANPPATVVPTPPVNR